MRDRRLQRYIDYYEALTPATVKDIGLFMTDDVHFSDPFNDVIGLDETRRIFDKMFLDLDHVKFKITRAAVADGNDTCALLSWQLEATLKKSGKPMNIVGMSDIRFAEDGRVCEHIDHWDPGRQIYEHLPVLGAIIGRIRSHLAA